VYPEPDSFKPERFLNRDGTVRYDPVLLAVFGYGKRICPGKPFVDATVTLFMVSHQYSQFSVSGGQIVRLVAPSTIRIRVPSQGTSTLFRVDRKADLRRPNPFSCSFTPTYEELIMADSMARR
jgi:hypothetical protein